MKKQNPVLNTLANMNKKEETEMTNDQLQNEKIGRASCRERV